MSEARALTATEDRGQGISRRRLLSAGSAFPLAAALAPFSLATRRALGAELFTLRATAGANVGYANLFVAEGAGIAKKYGIDAPVRLFDVGFLGTEATLAGQADLSGITEFPLVTLLAKGGDLVAVAVDDRSDDLKLVVTAGIKQPDDLRGKRVGLIYGSTAQYAFDHYMAHFKLTGAVKVINIDAADQTVSLVKGDIDGFVWLDPVVANAFKVLGSKIHILKPGIETVYKTHLYAIMSRPWAEKNRVHVENYLRALSEANNFILSHPDQAAQIVAKKLNISADLVPQYIKNAGFDWKLVWTKGSVQALYDAAQWMKENGKIKHIPDLRAAVDTSYLKAVAPASVQI